MSIGDWFKDKDTDLLAGSAVDAQMRKAQIDKHFAEAQRRMDQVANKYTSDISNMPWQNALGGVAMQAGSAARGYSPIEKLLMRLNVRESSQSGFNYLGAVENSAKENVVVFLITKNGEALHVEDDRALFPTDGLVARLNILRG